MITCNEKSLSVFGKWVLAAHGLIWLGVTSCLVLFEARFPGTDVFLFKEAAVNFALKTRLVASNLIYMPLDTELPFAHYPPVYPLVMGVWMKMFGIGLKQSLLFECLLRGVRALLLGALIWPSLKQAFNHKPSRLWAALTVLFLTLTSFLSTDDDRPDELGLVFGFTCWWLLLKASRNSDYFLSGLVLGLTGATSPACSVAIGMGALFYLWTKVKGFTSLTIFTSGAFVMFVACVSPIPLAHPEMLKRFSVSAGASSLPYPLPWVKGVPFSKFWAKFQYCMNHYFSLGFNLIVSLSGVLALVIFFRHRFKIQIHPFQWASIVFALVAPWVWSLQPYYVWFASLPLVLFFIGEELKASPQRKRLAFIGAYIAFLPLMLQESKNAINLINRPKEETMSYVREHLLKEIKPHERIAVSFDQFFTLRNQREVAHVGFVCREISRFDYIYVTRIWNAKQGQPSVVPVPCWNTKQLACFEPIQNLAQNAPIKIAGLKTGYNVRGHGGTLYKNIHCSQSISHRVASGF